MVHIYCLRKGSRNEYISRAHGNTRVVSYKLPCSALELLTDRPRMNFQLKSSQHRLRPDVDDDLLPEAHGDSAYLLTYPEQLLWDIHHYPIHALHHLPCNLQRASECLVEDPVQRLYPLPYRSRQVHENGSTKIAYRIPDIAKSDFLQHCPDGQHDGV